MVYHILSRVLATFFLCLSLIPQSNAEDINITQKQKDTLVAADILFTMKGSNTIGEKLAPALAAKYLESQGAEKTEIIKTHTVEKTVVGTMADGSLQAIDIKAHGSSTSFQALAEKDTDIGMSSRRVKDKERQQLNTLYGDLASMENEYTIAVDGLAVIVHPELNIKQLNTKQLALIFSGEITNWQ